jgi:hypothetical protein
MAILIGRVTSEASRRSENYLAFAEEARNHSPYELLPASTLLSGQPAAIGIPHDTGIPHHAPAVSRARNLRR